MSENVRSCAQSETERADGNFESYERVKQKYSEATNRITELETTLIDIRGLLEVDSHADLTWTERAILIAARAALKGKGAS